MNATWASLPLKENSKDDVTNALTVLPMSLVDKFLIISSEGVYHTSHFDPNGFHTMLRVERGKKLVLLGVPRGGHGKITPYVTSHWDLFADESLDIYLCLIEAGSTL